MSEGLTRKWEVDAGRGVAVLLMVSFHFFFDLNYFNLMQINLHAGFFLFFQRIVAFLFLTLVGVSLVLFKQKHPFLSDFFKRSLLLAFVALLITAATSVYPGKGAIVFGVIHFIALSVLLGFFFLDFYLLNLALALLLLASSLFISLPSFGTSFFLWLGFPPANFYTLDYYPLYPWFGLVLLGIFVGKMLYEKNKIQLKKPFDTSFFELLGRNALLIYLLQQPVLISMLLFLSWLLR